MSVLLRLCCSLVVLAPSLVLAATLETPGNGDNLSGIGVIRGWKCEAVGDITVVIDGGGPIPMAYGNDRLDTQGSCGDSRNGFVSIINWGEFSTGEHTAVAYDNGVEFARSTFTVVRASEEESYLQDVTAECAVPDFPDPGINASFEWNQGTQHLELAEVGEDVVVPVSTRFDGEWDYDLEIRTDFYEVCDCYQNARIVGSFEVENGYIPTSYVYDCVYEAGVRRDGIVSPTGELQGSYRREAELDDGELLLLPWGSFEGSLSEDGTGMGTWSTAAGCAGQWFAERREDS